MTKEEKVLIDAIMALVEVIAEIKGEGEPSERAGTTVGIASETLARYDGSYYESHMFSEATGPVPWPLLGRATSRTRSLVGIAAEDCKKGDLLTVITTGKIRMGEL